VRCVPRFLLAALVAAGCSDAARSVNPAPRFGAAATGGSGITLDQFSGLANDAIPWGQGETHIGKGFNPNPHPGDAIVATFYWKGSSNTIVQVTDHLCDVANTPVGNTYTLVDYATRGGYSMATYVATNAQGFSAQAVSTDSLLCVHAIFSNQISEGGMIMSAYQGVAAATALDGFHSATGFDSTTAPVDPGAISGAAGDLAYAIAMSNGVVGSNPPAGFKPITDVSDTILRADAEYAVLASAGTVEPQWTWFFQAPSSWLATVVALRPAPGTANRPPVAAFSSSCSALTCGFTNSSSDSDGTIASNSWSFGDGQTSAVASPSHTYGTGGTYTVTLTVTDNQGATNSVSHSVTVTAPNQPPTAAFASSCNALTCAFTNSSSDPDGTIASNSWNFGDGQTSTAASPSHIYAAGGTYTVTLTVTDNQGATTSVSHSVTVTPPNQAPVVNAGADQTVLLGVLYTLNASFSDPDNGPWTYTIQWGDGSTTTGTKTSNGTISAGHTYLWVLTRRTITVTVTDSRGASGADSKVVTLIL